MEGEDDCNNEAHSFIATPIVIIRGRTLNVKNTLDISCDGN